MAETSVDLSSPTARIKALSAQASSVSIDTTIPVKRYYRSSIELLRMARVYKCEGNLEPAFVLYQKYLCLMVEQLPRHPEYNNNGATVIDKKIAKRSCSEALADAENIKKQLKERYEVEFQKRLLAEQERLRLLQIEEEKRAKDAEYRRQQEEAQRMRDEEERARKAREEEDRKYAMFVQQELSKEAIAPGAPPSVPSPSPSAVPSFPPPAYTPVSSTDARYSPATNSTPEVDRSTKPLHYTQTTSDSVTTNKYGLKNVRVPVSIGKSFAAIAQLNTSRNVETCGLLCGKLRQGSFFINHVVIPKQRGTSDSCATLNEEEIFDFQDTNDLITLGWIHTHPSQTAFLSSVDLHTHASYQLMMPEAIAIVVSPKYDEVGTFHLTPEYGLDCIAGCTQIGFHPHPKDPPLFQQCDHVIFDASYNANIIDLR